MNHKRNSMSKLILLTLFFLYCVRVQEDKLLSCAIMHQANSSLSLNKQHPNRRRNCGVFSSEIRKLLRFSKKIVFQL